MSAQSLSIRGEKSTTSTASRRYSGFSTHSGLDTGSASHDVDRRASQDPPLSLGSSPVSKVPKLCPTTTAIFKSPQSSDEKEEGENVQNNGSDEQTTAVVNGYHEGN